MRVKMTRIFLMLGGILLLYGSSTPFLQVLQAQTKTEISYSTAIWPAREKIVKKTIVNFEEKYPDIKINLIGMPNTEYHDKIITMIAGGTAPDVIHFWYAALPEIIEAGLALNLEPFIQQYKFDRDNLPLKALQPYERNGDLYALPRDGGPFGDSNIYYNTDLFDKAGISYPFSYPEDPYKGWTWDEMLEIAKKLTQDTNGDGRIDQWGVHFPYWRVQHCMLIWANGGRYFNDDYTQCLIDQPEAYEGLQFLADLYNKYQVSPLPAELGGLGNPFSAGQCGMMLGPVMYGQRIEEMGVEFDWNIADLPRGKAGRVNWVAANPLVIYSNTQYPEEAWKFVQYTLSDENQYMQTVETRSFPPQTKYAAHLEDFMYAGGKDYRPFVFGIENGRTNPGIIGWEEIMDTIIMPELELAFLGKTTAKKATATIAKKVNEFLAKQR